MSTTFWDDNVKTMMEDIYVMYYDMFVLGRWWAGN